MQLYHITINNLRRRIAKMLFVLLGLSIGIATVVSVYGIVDAMVTEMTEQVTGYGVNVVITPDAGGLTFSYGGVTLPEIMYDVEQLTNTDLAAIDELPSAGMVKVVAPKLLGVSTTGDGGRVVVVGANLVQEFTVKPWLRIDDGSPRESMTVDDKQMDFDLLDLTRQEMERLDITDSQVVLGAKLATSLDLKEGDSIQLGGQQLEVAGVLFESGAAEDNQAFMNLSAAQTLLGRPGEITVIEMAVDYFQGSEEALIAQLNEAMPHTRVTSFRQESLRRDDMLGRLVRFGTSISVLILLVGMLVVGLTMAGSVRERTREIGVFRALGFRKSHISQLIILEGMLLSLVGGILGYFAGTWIARLAGPVFTGMDVQVGWKLDFLAMAIGLALLTGLLASIYPAHLAAKQDPVEALRFI